MKRANSGSKRTRRSSVGLDFSRRKEEILREVKQEFLRRKYLLRTFRSRGLQTLVTRREMEKRVEKEFPKASRFPRKKGG